MPRRRSDRGALRRAWRDYGLSIVVGAMFIVTFILHVAFGWWQYAAEQAAHGAEATFWGPDGYIAPLGEWTFQNWQSEFMIVLFMILATTRLIHRGSHESKDGTEEMQRSINRIEKRVAAVVQRRQGR